MLENIPPEIRAIPHWVMSGPNKIPLNPRTGQAADPADPTTGGTFLEAASAGLRNVGFILSNQNDFVVIDLDNPFRRSHDKSLIQPGDNDFAEAQERAQRHSKIYETFGTYAELSQSGEGVHLVMRGAIPCPVKRDKVEIYQDARYMIFTGNVLRQAPVVNCQPALDALFADIGRLVGPRGELIEEDPVLSDAEIWAMATRASNAEKFIALCEGRPEMLARYPSQSEADHALMSMFCFYTRSNEQARRMFRQTVLGQRPKAQRNDKYLNFTLGAIRAKEAPPVNISNLLSVPVAVPAPPVPPNPNDEPEDMELHELPKVGQPTRGGYSFPPGLIGDVASYILSSSIRPVPEVALAAALALTAGICGRSYNVSGNGLNQYLILLAKTGRGKEGAATGIDNLMAEVRKMSPVADQFIGPAAFASGPALVRVLTKQPCFVSVLGEFGLTLQTICDPRATSAEIMLKRVLLDVYGKSGRTKVLRSSVYSDSERNTGLIHAPNVTLLGESTPGTFYDSLDLVHIAEGLIPRFSVIEYTGNRPPPNKNAFHPPGDDLVQRLARFVAVSVNTANNNTCVPVAATPEGQKLLDKFNASVDARINRAANEVTVELWNRAHLKACKLAALVAVGMDWEQPIISEAVAQWSIDFVYRETGDVLARFESGDIGTGEAKQEAEIRRLFLHFQELDPKQRASHRCPEPLMDKQVCPAPYFTIYTRRLACFKNARQGASRALADCLADMVKREVFEMVPLTQLSEFGMRSAIYYPGKGW